MHTSLEKLNLITNKVNEIIKKKQLKTKPQIIVITKKFSLDKIKPLINSGHLHFGENQIKEAELKWTEERKINNKLQLHMVGKLQSNKAKKALKLFDYIHSLDNAKLASKISQYERELNKKVKLFIQINLGDEIQKSGVVLKDVNNFYNYCTKDLSLNIVGLMCLPPVQSNPEEYFKLLKSVSLKLNLKNLSMGMSSDFDIAVAFGATFLRLGTAVMGVRNSIS
tara:strand:+ start:61 stop:732 length:672 start_codon:yes stop_codon:yes gene_type:complete